MMRFKLSDDIENLVLQLKFPAERERPNISRLRTRKKSMHKFGLIVAALSQDFLMMTLVPYLRL